MKTIDSDGVIVLRSDVQKIKDFLDEAQSLEIDETYRMVIGQDDKSNYYLVAGYMDDFDDGEYHLCAKIARLVSDVMSEYDIDFVMPYDPETGDVWDTEVSDVTSADAKWFYDEFNEMIAASKDSDGSVSYDAYFDGSYYGAYDDLAEAVNSIKDQISTASYDVDLSECWVENSETGEVEYTADGDSDYVNI